MWFTLLPTSATSITDNSEAEIKKKVVWGFGFGFFFWLYHLPASSIELLRNKTFLLNQISTINLDRERLNQYYLQMIYEGRYFST